MVNFFGLKRLPGIGSLDNRSPELLLNLQNLSSQIVAIFGDVEAASVFVERTVRQLRCSVGPCMYCGSMTRRMLMCIGCQRIIAFGAGVINDSPKKSKQMAYFRQFSPQMLKRAWKVVLVRNGHKATRIQALARGWLKRRACS